ncbi:unnamed protein product [Camellia sinensis]
MMAEAKFGHRLKMVIKMGIQIKTSVVGSKVGAPKESASNPDWSSPVELLQSYTKPEASICARNLLQTSIGALR